MVNKDDLKQLSTLSKELESIQSKIGMIKINNPASGFKNKRNGQNAESAFIKAQGFIGDAVKQLNRVL